MGSYRKLKKPSSFSSLGFVTVIASVIFLKEQIFSVLKSIWIWGGDVRQSLWNKVLNTFGEDQFSLWVSGAFLILTIQYWIVGGLYTLMDLQLTPKILKKFKIQPGTNEPLCKKKLIQVVIQVLFNQIIVGIPAIYLGGKLFIWRRPPPIRKLPNFHWVLFQFIFFLLEQEFCYYYIHRCLHSKALYKFIHKKHHEWSSPVAISAIYCHPIEQMTANLFPVFFGCFLVNAHLTTYLSWFSLAVWFTLSEHSGYHLPFMTSPEVHDFHHYSFNNNFGFLGLLDCFHGTNSLYLKSKASQRHFILKGFKSVRELVPDD